MLLIMFFCKPKTAYEMRISDWRSDVCSSDLRRPRPEPAKPCRTARQRRGCEWMLSSGRSSEDEIDADGNDVAVVVAGRGNPDGVVEDLLSATGEQIGRASGRERVWKYV